VEDITESLNAVAALVESEARNAAVIDATLDAMIVIDAEATVTAFNPAAERMFGYHKDQVIGHQLAEMLIPERFREAHLMGVRKNLAAGAKSLSRRVELYALRADGTPYVIEVNPNPWLDKSAEFAMAARKSKPELSYGDMIEKIVELAMSRPMRERGAAK